MSGKIFIAKDSFAIRLDGVDHVIHKGITRVREGHALLKGREALFEELKVQYEVEQATAAPAEKRAAPEPKPEPKPEPEPEPAKAEPEKPTKAAKADEK